jgi:hypothetical protein
VVVVVVGLEAVLQPFFRSSNVRSDYLSAIISFGHLLNPTSGYSGAFSTICGEIGWNLNQTKIVHNFRVNIFEELKACSLLVASIISNGFFLFLSVLCFSRYVKALYVSSHNILGGFTIGIYKIFKARFKVFIDNFLENEKAVLFVQDPQNL